MRTERCACGGSVTASPLAPMAAVELHNQTVQHTLWRYQREVRMVGPERSTAIVSIRDVSGCGPRASTPPVRA